MPHQGSVDRISAINDYTIREEALKSNTFQFRSHKASGLIINSKPSLGGKLRSLGLSGGVRKTQISLKQLLHG